MLSYCLKCKRNTESINPKVLKTTNGKAIILPKCAICGSKKSKFMKEQEAKGLRHVLFMMLRILIVKILQKEPLQIKF